MKPTSFPPSSEAAPSPRPMTPWSRRQFLQTTAVAGLAAPFLLSGRTARADAKPASPNAKLNHACIGVGGMGAVDLKEFLKHPRVQIVALCDVDSDTLNKAAKE